MSYDFKPGDEVYVCRRWMAAEIRLRSIGMEWQPLADWALTEADRMVIESSRMRQLGFKHLAAHLAEQSTAARDWADAAYRAGSDRVSCPLVPR